MSERLDRIEQILAETANRQQVHDQWFAEMRQLTESNARAIEANTRAIEETRASLRAEVNNLVVMITTMSDQAAIERAEFRAIVQGILDSWNQRFSGNGQ